MRERMWLVVLVGLIWGITNPLLKHQTKTGDNRSGSGIVARVKQIAPAYLINMAGSVLFNYALTCKHNRWQHVRDLPHCTCNNNQTRM